MALTASCNNNYIFGMQQSHLFGGSCSFMNFMHRQWPRSQLQVHIIHRERMPLVC